ncbi:unnamed protein product [Allacma fusca]|uniref:Uncharacterized protein n=1 Tax=Allacma fusca TaxID=39272 RepID=A0A8J2JAI6_9HEXA|nr:unnamed protein product [Allacma fusca]
MQSLFLVAIVIAFSSSIVFGDEVLKEALKSELNKPDQNSSEGINEVIQSINSSLISLKTRLSSLETKVGHVDEKPAGELSPATETRLGGNPAGDLSNNVKTIKQELANLTSEYNKVVGKVGVNAIANDQLNETVNSTEVTTESSGIKSVTELLAGKLTTTLKSDEPAAQSLNTSSNTGANNQATTKSVPKVTLKTDDKPQQVESSTSKISDEPDSTTEIVQEETTISS